MASQKRREAFDLQPLLYPALPLDPSINPASPAALNRSIRCAEPYKSNLYLGASDGQVYCFVQPPIDDGNGSTSSNELRHVGTRSISSKPIDKILIISSLGIAAVLSEATLTFHELPSFLPIPPQVLPHSKGVASVVLDDEEVSQSWEGGVGLDEEGLCNLCIIRRKAITLVKVGVDTWRVIKEIPLPKGATVARRSGNSLCIATTTEYNMVDLDAATMSDIGLPITQTGDTPSAANRPSILSIPSSKAACEFLITSHSESSTLGVFVSQEGDPTAKLLEWPSHPRALALEYPFVHALLRNDSIEIHNVITMEKIQTLHLPQLLEPRLLSLATSTLELAESKEVQMTLVNVRLERGGKRSRSPENPTSWKQRVLGERRTRSRALLIGKNAVQCLCTTRILDTAKKALEKGDYDRVKDILEQAWDQQGLVSKQTGEEVELEYLHQMMAVHCLRQLHFEDARNYILRGNLDPRVVLHLFPTIFAGVADETESQVEIFADVEQGLSELGDLDRYPITNLQLNYTPPLEVEGEEVLQRLREKMTARIRGLLRNLLDEYRDRETTQSDKSLARVLDTCLAKLIIAEEQREELANFLAGSKLCDVDLLEPYLSDMGCFAALLRIKQGRSDWPGMLELLTRLLDGELQDHTFQGSLQDVVNLLERCPDADLIHQYSLWVIQRDSEAGIRLLTKDKASGDQRSMVEEVRAIDERAADALLEYTALSKKQHAAEAHMELAQLLVTRLHKAFENVEERKLMEEVTEDYIRGQYAESFVAHMALRCDQTQTIVQRLKLIMLLQASAVLDVVEVLKWVQGEPLLLFERAILLGKQRKDVDALEVLAIHLRDANSAEIYCNQNRYALSSVQLQSLAVEQKQLVLYSNCYAKSLRKTSRDNKVKLLKVLLQVYMERGGSSDFQVATSHLLNTQSLNLSPLEVLHLVPNKWSLSTLETFLSRSLRKEMHRANEGQIQRNVALAQNLEVAEMLWAKRRGLGGVIEDGSPAEGGEVEGADAIDAVEVLVGEKIIEKPDVFELSE